MVRITERILQRALACIWVKVGFYTFFVPFALFHLTDLSEKELFTAIFSNFVHQKINSAF